jgi:hypothetical protein
VHSRALIVHVRDVGMTAGRCDAVRAVAATS